MRTPRRTSPRAAPVAALCALAALLVLPGCYERKETVLLNPDGSGKMLIETDVPVPNLDASGKNKPSAVDFGREFTASMINRTRGVDSWSDVVITQAPDGRAHVTAVAYFPDISQVRIEDIPLAFSWKKQENGAFMLTIERPRNPATEPSSLTDAQLKEQVSKAQAQFKDQQLALQTALSTFTLNISFELPGDVVDAHLLTKKDHTVSLTLEGKKISAALDKFMADDAALAATIKSGVDGAQNDDYLLAAMYGQKGPISATVKVPADSLPVFNYRTESRTAALGQHDMLEAAGVQLVPRFIVKPPATQPGGR